MKTVLTTILTIILLVPDTYAQFGKILKEVVKSDAVKDLARRQVVKELEEMRSEYDSSSFNYAIALSDNAGLFESKERFERHQKFLLEYLDRKDGNVSAEDQARGWVDRAELLYANGKYKLAMGLLIGAKTVYESEGSTRNIDYARTLANLSLVSHSLGRLNFAEEYGQMALDMRKELFGEESRGYAASVNNMALIQKDLGHYNEAQKRLEEAVDKNRDVLGPESMGHAIALNNLGALNQLLGRFDRAEPLYLQAIEIAEGHLKEKSGNYQRLQTNLALLYQDMGRYEEAEEIYLEAIDLKEKRFGSSHPDYAHLLNNLASLYMLMEKYEDVEELLTESVDIYEDKLGPESPATASAKSDLAAYYIFQSRYMEGLNLLKDVENARISQLGEDHPATIQTREDLAIARWKLGETDRAVNLYREVLRSTYETIDNYFLPMSEHEKTRFWSGLRPRLHRFYSFAYEIRDTHPELLIDLVELQAATKAMLMNSTNKIRNEILNGDDQELKQRYLDWVDQKELLAHYYTYSKEELQEENINLDSLERAANASERYLSENSESMRNQLTAERPAYQDIRASLGNGERLVEVIHARVFENSLTDQYRYLVLIISPEAERPQLVALDNGNQLDSRYFKYYTNVIHNQMQDDYSYSQYWEAVDNQLGNNSRIYVSPDGVYNQINLNTLRKPDGTFVIEDHQITVISNPADIIELKKRGATSGDREAVLVGYPQYGGSGSINLLPGTRVEVQTIDEVLKGQSYSTVKIMEEDATESRIKSVKPEGIFHVATHGFFLESVSHQNSLFGINTERAGDNPLLRSGLMFTGAGISAEGGEYQGLEGNDDGILTSFEAMNLSLENTDLVVLSACETGLGDVQSGEGVYGLQRAITVAGAKNLLMSLWKVDDQATQQLMTHFYGELARGETIESAFREAQLSLKKDYPSPYYWGAFIYVAK